MMRPSGSIEKAQQITVVVGGPHPTHVPHDGNVLEKFNFSKLA